MLQFLEESQWLTPKQHGFVRGRSCLTNLLEAFENWTELLDEGHGIDIIYLDYRKAFDTVPHKRLLSKVQQARIGGKVLNWIKAFLSDREMRVVVNKQSQHGLRLSLEYCRVCIGPATLLMYRVRK